jgi:HEAT repeat protein
MTIDINRVKRLLDCDEPNYAAVARLGAAVLPALRRFVSGPDQNLASKAASAAGLINDPRATEVLQQAARSPSVLVRLAAAGATRTTQGPGVGQVILALMRDADPGVRKFAIKAAAGRPNDTTLAARVRAIQASDPAPGNRTLAARALRRPTTRRIG